MFVEINQYFKLKSAIIPNHLLNTGRLIKYDCTMVIFLCQTQRPYRDILKLPCTT